MIARFVPISTEDERNHLIMASARTAVIAYLHDPYCGLSTLAHRQVSQLDGEVAPVDVHSGHDLFDEIERRTGFRHESPHVFVFLDGHPVWSDSHRKVTAAGIARASPSGSTLILDRRIRGRAGHAGGSGGREAPHPPG